MMTVELVQEKLKQVEALAQEGDYEAARDCEDSIFDGVLQAIASGAGNAAELAQTALLSKSIKFTRYCA